MPRWCCSAHMALLSTLLPLLLNHVLCGGGGQVVSAKELAQTKELAHSKVRVSVSLVNGVGEELLVRLDAAPWRGSELERFQLKLCRFGGRRGVRERAGSGWLLRRRPRGDKCHGLKGDAGTMAAQFLQGVSGQSRCDAVAKCLLVDRKIRSSTTTGQADEFVIWSAS